MNAQVRSLFTLCLLASAAHAQVITITDEAVFDKEINKSGKFAVVKFAAEWCGVCKSVKQPFEELSKEDAYKGVLFANVDIDKANGLADKHGVGGVPTFVFVAEGKKVGTEVGIQDTKTFKESMRNHIANYSAKNAQTSVDARDINQPAQAPEAVEPDQQAEAAGIVASIVKTVKLVIAVIIGLVQYTIDAIKGLFSR